MDTFSHALWGKALFGYKKYLYLPLFFGAAPDLLPFIPNLFYKLINGNFSYGKPSISSNPDWVFLIYDFSHSLITGFLLVMIYIKMNHNGNPTKNIVMINGIIGLKKLKKIKL